MRRWYTGICYLTYYKGLTFAIRAAGNGGMIWSLPHNWYNNVDDTSAICMTDSVSGAGHNLRESGHPLRVCTPGTPAMLTLSARISESTVKCEISVRCLSIHSPRCFNAKVLLVDISVKDGERSLDPFRLKIRSEKMHTYLDGISVRSRGRRMCPG